jgi:hypothetical protein
VSATGSVWASQGGRTSAATATVTGKEGVSGKQTGTGTAASATPTSGGSAEKMGGLWIGALSLVTVLLF